MQSIFKAFQANFTKLNHKIFNHEYNWLSVSVVTYCFLWFFYNFSFFNELFGVYKTNLSVSFKILSFFDLLSVFLLLFIVFFSYKKIFKPVSILLFLVTSVTSYMSDNYNVVFDTDMLRNVFQTNKGEAFSYFSRRLLGHFVVFGILPSLVIYKIKIHYPSFKKVFLQRTVFSLILLTFSAVVTVMNYQQLSFIARQHRYIYKKIQPFHYLLAAGKVIKQDYLTIPPAYVRRGDDAKIESTTKPKLVVIVVGETARIHNYAYAGYPRGTNQFTQAYNLFQFTDVTSCGTATAHSVPCMFTDLTRDNFSYLKARNQDNLFDVFRKVGINEAWFDNDGGCKGMCDRIPAINIPVKKSTFCNGESCFDAVLLDYVKKQLAKDVKSQEDAVIIVHLIGSHGPRYFERYPKNFAQFLPECRSADVENCSLESLMNSYDNTILYTDYIISQLILALKPYEETRATALLYVSDHGESLGENGAFLHGMPYIIAPIYQKKVPMQIYFGANTLKDLRVNSSCLTLQTTKPQSHDNLYHTLLGLLQVKTDEYQQNLDIFARCKANPT